MTRLRADDRGLAVQVGVTILLGFVVIALATYQVQVVPSQNARVEFTHSQTVQGQLQDVRGAVVSVPGGGAGRSVSVQLGVTYPDRAVFVNPPAPSGQLRATDPANLTIENATAVGDREVGDFWTGATRNVTTRGLVYRPDYNVYQSAPTTVVENTVVYDRTPDGTVVVESDQRLVDGNRINLVALQGAYQEAGVGTVAVDVRATSSSTRTVAVTGAGGANLTLTVPTRLGATEWRDLLADEDNVLAVRDGPRAGTVTLVLDGSEVYELRMAKVGLTNGVDRPGPAYVVPVAGDGESVGPGQSQTLVAEVRDAFNNPVTGVTVNASVVDGPGTVRAAAATTDADGRASFVYSSSTPGTATVRVNFSTTEAESRQANFTVQVSGSGGGGGGFDPVDGVIVTDSVITSNSNDAATVGVTFENKASDRKRNVTGAQYTLFSTDGEGGSTRSAPTALTIRATTLDLRGDLRTIQPRAIRLNESESKSVDFVFDDCVEQGDFFVVTLAFEDGQFVQYVVAPTGGSTCGGGGGMNP